LEAILEVEITKNRIFNGEIVKVGDKTEMDEFYFKAAGHRFAKKIGESKEIKTEEKSPKKAKKKKNEDKEMVAETK
jgi:hypothetical protein